MRLPSFSFAGKDAAARHMTHHRLTFNQFLILAFVSVSVPLGDAALSRGMTSLPPISMAHPLSLIGAVFTPWIALGIALLIGYFASYLTALSWADLTYVMPATAFGNVFVALLAHYWLHEDISWMRWMGIVMITVGVAFVAHGPVNTTPPVNAATTCARRDWTRKRPGDDRCTDAAIVLEWAAGIIAIVVITSSIGEVLTAAAMKSMGDLDDIRARRGLSGAIKAVVTSPAVHGRNLFMAVAFFSLLFALNHMNLSLVGPAAASLTLVLNTVAAQLFLHEKVDRRRWTAAVLVCVGVYFLAH